MTAIDEVVSRLARRDVRCTFDGYCRDYSRWNDWGRWVALAIIIIGVLFIAFVFSCLNNRRRRRRGAAPIYGTGWMPFNGKPPQNAYYPNQPYNGGAAPPYSPPIGQQATGNTFNSNDGYYGQNQYGHNNYNQSPYGGQQQGVELQPPQNAYQPQRGGSNVYEAPQGPPPGKGDGVIR